MSEHDLFCDQQLDTTLQVHSLPLQRPADTCLDKSRSASVRRAEILRPVVPRAYCKGRKAIEVSAEACRCSAGSQGCKVHIYNKQPIPQCHARHCFDLPTF